MYTIQAQGRSFEITRAQEADVAAIVALLADDVLGAGREGTDLEPYLAAYSRIADDPGQLLVAVRDGQGEVIATMQLSLIPGLSRGGTTRLQIEAVRVAKSVAGLGIGTQMVEWAHDYGRRHGARLAQLTTDKSRADAHRFYARLGYEASHEGMKLPL